MIKVGLSGKDPSGIQVAAPGLNQDVLPTIAEHGLSCPTS